MKVKIEHFLIFFLYNKNVHAKWCRMQTAMLQNSVMCPMLSFVDINRGNFDNPRKVRQELNLRLRKARKISTVINYIYIYQLYQRNKNYAIN